MTARRALRWGAIGFTAAVLGALGSGCELIAGTHQRTLDKAGAGGDASASMSASASVSVAAAGGTSGSAGGGGSGGGGSGGGTGGSDPIPWPDSATAFCAIDGMAAKKCSETANTNFQKQDGDFVIHLPSYTISGSGADKTITDTVTSLIWQGDFSLVIGKDLTWQNAKNSCEARMAAGETDWRMPTRLELASLLDTGHTPTASAGLAPIFPAPFDALIADAQTEDAFYWVDAEAQDDDSKAWAIKLLPFNGTVFRTAKSAQNGRALCVRGTTAYQKPNLIVEGQVVRDQVTGLVWQADMTPSMKWVDALSHCDQLSLGGMTGFRLPTLKELLYLVDDTQVSPALDHNAFAAAPTETFWSSSPYVGLPVNVFTVDFAFGETGTTNYQESRAVRCVR